VCACCATAGHSASDVGVLELWRPSMQSVALWALPEQVHAILFDKATEPPIAWKHCSTVVRKPLPIARSHGGTCFCRSQLGLYIGGGSLLGALGAASSALLCVCAQ
jgi:hypothetical protein